MLAIAVKLALVVILAAQDSAAAAPTAEQIGQAVAGLGAEKFEQRQAATELLWRAGQLAEGALAQAAKSSDPEVRTRATALLAKLRLGIRPDTSPELHSEPLEFNYVHPAQRSYK